MVSSIIADLTDGLSSAAIALLFAGQSFDAPSFCGQGDVGDPGMTLDDWANAINYAEPQLNIPAVRKARQWFQHVIFPILCDCTDGTSPPPTVTTAPPGTSGAPGVPPGTVGPNCWHQHVAQQVPETNANHFWNDLLPNIPPHKSPATPGTVGIQSPTPAWISATVSVDSNGSNPLPINFGWGGYDINGNLLSPSISILGLAPGAAPQTRTIQLPTAAVDWGIQTLDPAGGGTVSTANYTVDITIYCAGQSPTGVSSPCCPPDPSVDGRLSAIFEMLQQLLSLQALEGAYQDTIRHAGLSGNGTIAINPASSAIRVEVKSDLSNWPQNVQTPEYFYSLGFITPFAVGTPLKGQRLVYNHQTFSWPSYTDTIGYSLAPTLVVDLVELTRGA